MLHYTSVIWHRFSQSHISVMWILSCSEINSKEFLSTIIWKKCTWIFNSFGNALESECTASCSCTQHFKSKDQAVSITKHSRKKIMIENFLLMKWILFYTTITLKVSSQIKVCHKLSKACFIKSMHSFLLTTGISAYRFNTDQISSTY